MRDENKYVKAAAYKNIGAFIHTLKGRKIDPKLLEAYKKMATSEVDNISSDNDILFACAYNFSAVLDAMGSDSWSLLTSTYSRLINSSDKRIKRTLAASLHSVSRIIGDKRTKQHLFPVLGKFINDPSEEIKVAAIWNLSGILGVLGEEEREEMADVFMTLQNNQKKWRIKEAIAAQITSLAEVFTLHTIFGYLVPMAFKLCSDDVDCVRVIAASHVGGILKRFMSE